MPIPLTPADFAGISRRVLLASGLGLAAAGGVGAGGRADVRSGRASVLTAGQGPFDNLRDYLQPSCRNPACT
jgi:hypothetical protein